jgi:hypothetical protein
MLAHRDQWGDWRGEMEWVDLVEGEVACLKCAEELGIGPVAGGKGFESERGAAASAQAHEQEAGEESLANAGVGAGDENKAADRSAP